MKQLSRPREKRRAVHRALANSSCGRRTELFSVALRQLCYRMRCGLPNRWVCVFRRLQRSALFPLFRARSPLTNSFFCATRCVAASETVGLLLRFHTPTAARAWREPSGCQILFQGAQSCTPSALSRPFRQQNWFRSRRGVVLRKNRNPI